MGAGGAGGGTERGSAEAVRLCDGPEAGDETLEAGAGESGPAAAGENGDGGPALPPLRGLLGGMAFARRGSREWRNL